MNAADVLPTRFNVASYFVDRWVSAGRGDRVAYRCDGRTLTYGELHDLASRTGSALRDLGIRMEERVLLVCLDRPEFLGAFWGAIKLGAVPIPVNTLMRSGDFLHFLNDSRARALVVSAPRLDQIEPRARAREPAARERPDVAR